MRKALAISVFAASSLLLAEAVHAEKVFQQRTAASTSLPTAGGVFITVLQIDVPAGRWVIQAKTQAGSFADFDIVVCQLFKGNTSLDSSETNVGGADGYPTAAIIYNQAVTRTTTTSAIRVLCKHNNTQASLFINAGASLIIEEVAP